ncbi:MAG TPA: phosphonopyruvate decarboxylase [Opitutaceae bacterium]|jgi:phosphonopyruvate decarboxylase
MLEAPALLSLLHGKGIRLISGTPCSYLKPLINAALGDPRFTFRDAVNEGDAVAMAAGARLAGAPGAAIFQNSGLGNAVNTLTSLCHPFQVPVLLVVTRRGEPGGKPDEPQHELMGRITPALLDTMEIPWARLPSEAAAAAAAVDHAFASMERRSGPFALLVSDGTLAPHPLAARPDAGPIGERTFSFSENLTRPFGRRASRTEALALLRAGRAPSECLVATTGYTGRELYALGDEPWNLYMVGSMGSASAFGLGASLFLGGRPVTVIDGDGAALMRLGNLATLGAYAPPSLTHVVLDNEAHDSTGGQPTVSRGVALAAIAQACGYGSVVSTDDPAELARALAHPRPRGPLFIHFRTRTGASKDLPRPSVAPAEVFRRLGRWLQG